MRLTTGIAFSLVLKRPAQSIAVGVSIAAAFLLFVAALNLLGSIEGSYGSMRARLAAPDAFMIYDGRSTPPADLVAWLRADPRVEAVSEPLPARQIMDPSSSRGRRIESGFIVAEYPALPPAIDKIEVVSALPGTGRSPAPGELWMPVKTAMSFELALGDEIIIPSPSGAYPLKVSALVVDSLFNSGFVNPVRVWVAPGFLSMIAKPTEFGEGTLTFRARPGAAPGAIVADFRAATGFAGWTFPSDLIALSYTMSNSMIGVAVLGIALVALFIALLVTAQAVRSGIERDYRTIGTFKALGFTPAQVARAFGLGYLLIALVAVPVGTLVSWPVTLGLAGSTAVSMGYSSLDLPFAQSALAGAGLFFLLIAVAGALGGRKAAAVRAIVAIRTGKPERRDKGRGEKHGAGFLRVSLPLFLSWSQVKESKFRALASLSAVVLAIFVAGFALSFLASFNGIVDHRSDWGFDEADIYASFSSKRVKVDPEAVKAEILAKAGVSFAGWSGFTKAIPVSEGYANDLVGSVYEGPMEAYGLDCLRGRHPRGPDEISVGISTAKTFGLEPGSPFPLVIEGQRRAYTVTGVYQCMSNMGQGFRIGWEAMVALDATRQPSHLLLFLTSGTDATAIAADLGKEYGDALGLETAPPGFKSIESINQSIVPVIALILVVFMAVIGTIIANDISAGARERMREFGVLKATGFTPGQLRGSLVLKALLVALAAAAIGVPVAMLASQPLVQAIGPALGLEKFPLVPDWTGATLVALLLVAFTAAVAFLASGRARRVDPRELITE